MKTIVFLCCFLTATSIFQGEHFALSEQGNRFQPVNNVQLLSTFSNIDIVASCAIYCFQNTLCRTFDFDSTTHQCHLYEGSVNTGILIPADPSSIVGWIAFDSSMFSSYNASADQCQNSRYLSSDVLSGLCQCPIHTFWDGSICANQRFAGDTCQENNWCRNDLNIGCIASICTVNPTTTTSTTTPIPKCTTLINFDDIENQSSTSGVIPNGYKNLNWTNAEYINASITSTDGGYRTAAGSRTFVMHNANGNNITISTGNGTRFSFDSVYFNSGWYDFLNFTFSTYRAGTLTAGGSYSAARAYLTWLYCDFCTNIDTIEFDIKGGTMTSNLTQNGTQLIITNLCISFGH